MNVGAMLISFVALICAGQRASSGSSRPGSMQMIFGWVFAPVAWSLGVPWKDAPTVGNLLGTRMVLNEFIAFAQLGALKESLDPRSFTIATFALCGFANFASIGMQIGGIGALAPTRRSDLARLGPAGDAGRHAREFRDRDHRRLPAVSAFEQAAEAAEWLRERECGDADVARRARLGPRRFRGSRSAARSRFPTATSRTGRRRASSVTPASSSAARVSGTRVLALSGRVHHYEGHDMQTGDLRDARDGPARRAARAS